MNHRPPGYELRSVSPSAGAQRFPGLLGPEMAKTRRSWPFRSTAVLRKMGQVLGQRTERLAQNLQGCKQHKTAKLVGDDEIPVKGTGTRRQHAADLPHFGGGKQSACPTVSDLAPPVNRRVPGGSPDPLFRSYAEEEKSCIATCVEMAGHMCHPSARFVGAIKQKEII